MVFRSSWFSKVLKNFKVPYLRFCLFSDQIIIINKHEILYQKHHLKKGYQSAIAQKGHFIF